MKLKRGLWGQALIQQPWCPFKKGKSGHRHAQKEDHVKTWGEDGHPHIEERGIRRNQPRQHLDGGLPASRTARKHISGV